MPDWDNTESRESDEDATWRDLVARFETPTTTAGPVPWPDREDVPRPQTAHEADGADGSPGGFSVLGLGADSVYTHHQIDRWKEGFAERGEEPDLSASQARVFQRLSFGVVGVLVLFIAILATWAIVIAAR